MDTKQEITDLFDVISDVRIAGVTFSNGRKKRQTILKKIDKQQKPFEISPEIILRIAEVDGSPAIEVWADDDQVGYIPKGKLKQFLKYASRPYYVYRQSIYGDDILGMMITVRFLKEGAECPFMLRTMQ